jgi:hypothetical protein
MFKFSYKDNGEVVEKEFDNYEDLIEFVVVNKIQDNDFVSMSLGETEITGGIQGLSDFALNLVQGIRDVKQAMASEDDIDDLDFADDYEEFNIDGDEE